MTAPFLLNDFANIYVRDFRLWLAIDYLFAKAFPLAIIFHLLRRGILSRSDLGLTRLPFDQFFRMTVVLTFIGLILDQFGWRFLGLYFVNKRFGSVPPIHHPVVFRIELYFGLAVVAIVEEMIFRGIYFNLLSKYLSRSIVLLVSTVAFGLIHWSGGFVAVLNTALIGAVFLVCVSKTGSVLPTIVGHFIVNFVWFSNFLRKL